MAKDLLTEQRMTFEPHSEFADQQQRQRSGKKSSPTPRTSGTTRTASPTKGKTSGGPREHAVEQFGEELPGAGGTVISTVAGLNQLAARGGLGSEGSCGSVRARARPRAGSLGRRSAVARRAWWSSLAQQRGRQPPGSYQPASARTHSLSLQEHEGRPGQLTMSDRLTQQEYDGLVRELLAQGPSFNAKATAEKLHLARKTVRRGWHSGWPKRGWKSAKELYEEQQASRDAPARRLEPWNNPAERDAFEKRLSYNALGLSALLENAVSQLRPVLGPLCVRATALAKDDKASLGEVLSLIRRVAAISKTTVECVQKAIELERARVGDPRKVDVTLTVEHQEVDPVAVEAEARALLAAIERERRQAEPPSLPASNAVVEIQC